LSTETPEPVTASAADRAERLAAVAADRELDAVLVTDLVNLRYVTGFTGSNGLALVGPGIRRFVTDFRYLLQSAGQLVGEWEREIATDVLARAAETLPDDRPFRLGFDDAALSVREHARLAGMVGDQVELVAAGGAVEDLRAARSPRSSTSCAPRRRSPTERSRTCSRAAWPAGRSATSPWTSTSRCAGWGPRPSRSTRSSPRAPTARCPTPIHARR
jgi:hypothetical protein